MERKERVAGALNMKGVHWGPIFRELRASLQSKLDDPLTGLISFEEVLAVPIWLAMIP